MKVFFLGDSHSANHLREAASWKGMQVKCNPHEAELIFISEDAPADQSGKRNLGLVREFALAAYRTYAAPIVLTSHVDPGFCRSLGFDVWYQIDTLSMRDSEYRARHPEQFVIGSATGQEPLPRAYAAYLDLFANSVGMYTRPVLRMTWEAAELARIAINIFLIGQVDATNRLAAIANYIGADWNSVREALKNDSRIGPRAYLAPGEWQQSLAMVRDACTVLMTEREALEKITSGLRH